MALSRVYTNDDYSELFIFYMKEFAGFFFEIENHVTFYENKINNSVSKKITWCYLLLLVFVGRNVLITSVIFMFVFDFLGMPFCDQNHQGTSILKPQCRI